MDSYLKKIFLFKENIYQHGKTLHNVYLSLHLVDAFGIIAYIKVIIYQATSVFCCLGQSQQNFE